MKYCPDRNEICYSPEEIQKVCNALTGAVNLLERVRLKVKTDEVTLNEMDLALNKLVCEIPDRLNVTNIHREAHYKT